MPAIKHASSTPDPIWMPLHEAVLWAFYRGNLPPEDLGMLGDGLFEEIQLVSGEEFRTVLSSGGIRAFGQRGYQEPEEIPANFWASAFGCPITTLGAWSCAPYRAVVVKRDEVMKRWPATTALPRPKGRPTEFDWERVRRMAAEEASALSRNKLAEVLRARYKDEINTRHVPSLSAMKTKLREWGGQ